MRLDNQHPILRLVFKAMQDAQNLFVASQPKPKEDFICIDEVNGEGLCGSQCSFCKEI